MKRKIYSIITMVVMLFACVFATACGDKYANMQFKILYAYSEDATEWFDGTEGISLNYSKENYEGVGDGSSLIFDENQVATLYVKIEVQNVKKKHVDSITVSFASLSGLNFSSKRVKQGQVFEIGITGNVETVMKLYENNSGKKSETSFVVSRKLENIIADTNIKPAITDSNGSSINLNALGNLSYLPLHQTNQVGVNYSIKSVGKYDSFNNYIANSTLNIEGYLSITDGLLQVVDGSCFESGDYVIKIRATSIYYPGSDEEEAISALFDVYVIENGITIPEVKFNNAEGKTLNSQVHIYENGGIYSTSTVFVDTALLKEESQFANPVPIRDGYISYTIGVYVQNQHGEFEKYNFGSAEHQSGINGLIIEDSSVSGLEENQFKFSIVNRNIVRNKVKIVYEIEGLDYSFAGIPAIEKGFDVVKSVAPTCITVNDALDLNSASDVQNAIVYGTTSAAYKGLELKLAVNPNEDLNKTITLVNEENGLTITNSKGLIVESELVDGKTTFKINTGETIFIKFKNNVISEQSLTLKTLKVPTFYEERDISTEIDTTLNSNNIIVNYKLTKVVTADALEFVNGLEGEETNSTLIDAENGGKIYAKVYYSGVNLDASTITLRSENESVLFGNGSQTISLAENGVVLKESKSDAKGKYNIYEISIAAPNGVVTTQISMTAGNGTVGIERSMTVSAVYLMTEDLLKGVNIFSTTTGVRKFNSEEVENAGFNFAISRGDFVEFRVVDGNGRTNTISEIKVTTRDIDDGVFGKTALNYNVISNSMFDVVGRIGGITQILDVEVVYYISDGNNVVRGSSFYEMQVAVFDGIGNISSSATKTTIGYINPFYTETSSTEVSFNSYTASYATPASFVTFKGLAGNVNIQHASQIEINVNAREAIKNTRSISIKYVAGATEIDLVAQEGAVVLQNAALEDLLNGKINISLNGPVTSVDSINITIRALKFGVASNVVTNVNINVAKVDKADGISVSGENFVQTSDTSNELQMSFMSVEDGGYQDVEFNASVYFDNPPTVNGIRFEDISTALTHVLYEYNFNKDGSVSLTRVQNDFLNITYSDGVVNVRAYKSRGGGTFRLVLATKDSYALFDEHGSFVDPKTVTLQESNFTTIHGVTIVVSDGELGSEYIINSIEELKLINYNLDSNFVLGTNLDLSHTTIKPLGLVDEILYPFSGSLNGSRSIIISATNVVVSTYSITMNVNSYAESTANGYVYGLFGIIDEDAEVKNLKFNIQYSSELINDKSIYGTRIGSVAGVNNGTISNVNVNISSSNVNLNKIKYGTVVDFGGIVGLNKGSIVDSTVECVDDLVINSDRSETLTHNIGLIAGTNDGTIAGSYSGKESLNNFIFDVIANVTVGYTNIADTGMFNVGSVAGTNNGYVQNLLVGGQLVMAEYERQKGGVGGIVGYNNYSTICNVTALSLNICSFAGEMNVGGIAGETQNSTINNVKFVSVETAFGSFTAYGQIYGKQLVAGVVANSNDSTIKYATVESFVEVVDNKISGEKETFYTIENGKSTAGLVARIDEDSTVDCSFVRANIKSSGTIILTTSYDDEENTYYIGKVNGTIDEDNTQYSVINGKINKLQEEQTITLSEYFEVDTSITEQTKIWNNIYKFDGTNYIKADSYEATTFYKFNTEEWAEFVEGLIDGEDWIVKENYNVININGVDLFMPYLLRTFDHDNDPATQEEQEALMIVAPQEIIANADEDYITSVSSVVIIEYNLEEYLDKISDAIIVNYFNGAGDEGNAHNIIEYVDNKGQTVEGLLNVEILPEDAQGGFMYEILGTGRNYAYINSRKEIVFTGVSGATPIIVRVYSGFNPEVEVYVAIYTQNLLTKLKLNTAAIKYENKEDYDYEINAYTNQSNIILTLDAENRLVGNNYSTIFNVYNLSQHLSVRAESNVDAGLSPEASSMSLLEIDTSIYSSISMKIIEDVDLPVEYSEIITFSLYISKDYFDGAILADDVKIAEVKLKVYLYNSAKGIEVNGEDSEITTHDDISLDVYLTTDFVDENEKMKIETLSVDENGNICLLDSAGHDSIIITLEVVEGQEEVKKLCEINEITHFAELFVDDSSIVRTLYVTEVDEKVVGYIYNVILEIKDEHNYRYINNNIKFNIIITAASNPTINNRNESVEILMQPTEVSTARIENYAIKTLNVNTDYTNIVTHEHVQTSIVEPGSLGNVMLIYLEPTYSSVQSVSIKTSELYVPSLRKNVKMHFTQLVHDLRKDGTGNFTTLYGSDVPTQVDDTLELKLVSSVDKNNKEIYSGVICVYIQLEAFSGLEATMTVELNITTNKGSVVTRSRELLTTYLPGTQILYDYEKFVDDGYLVQAGTSQNNVDIKIYGYQFNKNPDIFFEWKPVDGSEYVYIGGGTQTIWNDKDNDGIPDDDEKFLIGNYVSYTLLNNYDDVRYNPVDNSYTLTLQLNVSVDIMCPFTVSAALQLTTKNGEIKESKKEDNSLLFYPTKYILNSVYVSRLANGRKNVAINKTSSLELGFTTDNESKDLTDQIYNDLLNYVSVDAKVDAAKLGRMFSYYKNGTITFADTELHPEFEFNLVNNRIMSIFGVSKFSNVIKLEIWYGYVCDDNGVYSVRFGSNGEAGITSTLTFTFTLNVYAVDQDVEIPIYSADEIYNSETGEWDLVEGVNYVLMNDIVLENVVPISTPIARFDGNNRTISIKSFKVNDAATQYGLFASIGTYTIKDQETELDVTKQTMLRNVMVDYSMFNGTLALNNSTASTIYFGGLVGQNEGGLIYNCDVINLKPSADVTIDVIVNSTSQIVFGGLVGSNSGVITNSRIGRNEYTRIVATKTTESSATKRLGGLNFEIYFSKAENDKINQFGVVAGGFVGRNTGTISTSYVANTNLINFSTNETINITSGFVGENSGSIAYSYAKADNTTITTSIPYSTGNVIENKGNGIVSGFVYNNIGTISNSYANLELQTKSAYISGFVYNNTGKISESYAAATMNSGDSDNNAEQPFVGVDNAGNLLSNGTLENTYYLMRTDSDSPYKQGDKDIAYALNKSNFQNSEYLVGFAFVLSNIKSEREQGIWSYYTADNKKRILPELMNADFIAHSYRYIVDDENSNKVLVSAISYTEGSNKNPYTISSVDDYNRVFVENDTRSQNGYIRFINHIDFNSDESAIQTRSNYLLGSETKSVKTSVEGNGLTVKGIYLDVDNIVVDRVGMFGEIVNSYIKNLNLEFATPTTNGQFSTTTATYSGGLAGTIKDSIVLNISLKGGSTTLTGNNFVGGLAGLISGSSLVYGIETNLNVKASSADDYLYYSEKDYQALNIAYTTNLSYKDYLSKLSYAGGVAGVMDLDAKSNVNYNVQFIDVHGDQMSEKTFDGSKEANILAEYAGGVAGYVSKDTHGFRLKYFTGENEVIRGNTAVGGLFGVGLGSILASQVTAEEDTQYTYDTKLGEYVIKLETDVNAKLDTNNIGNIGLLEGYNYVGGLVGIGLNTTIKASYSKVGIVSGEVVGGLIGVGVSSNISYSYAVPYLNSYNGYLNVGGLMGSAYGIQNTSPSRNGEIAEFEALLKYYGVRTKNADAQYTYSTVVVDKTTFTKNPDSKFDYICANYKDEESGISYLNSGGSASFTSLYVGKISDGEIIKNQTEKASVVDFFRLFRVGNPDQTVAFQEVFAAWSIVKYWSLNPDKYLPLLINETVDNFIEIDEETDLEFIRTNPDGNFKVVKSFTIYSTYTANWFIDTTFTGILMGEIKDSSARPTITITGLQPTENNTVGFFKTTNNATITNIDFLWENPIDLTNVAEVSVVGAVTCQDIGSLISNVQVRTAHESSNTEDGYIIKEKTKTIEGFGGIVGSATDTNILNCKFIGKVEAVLKSDIQIDVGGIVAKAEGTNTPSDEVATASEPETTEEETGTAVINGCSVGAEKQTDTSTISYSTTSFKLSVADLNRAPVYIGGIVGYATNAAVASTKVGGPEHETAYKTIDMNVSFVNLSQIAYVAGGIGFAKEGLISNCTILTDLITTGTTASSSGVIINLGGLAGQYSVAGSDLTSGISGCYVKSNITTYYKEDSDVTQLIAKTKDQVMISVGVAQLKNASMKQCLLLGRIDTESADIENLLAGGAVAYSDANSVCDLEEIITDVEMYVGTSSTRKIYAGGLVGSVQKNIQISYSASWGRIIPITVANAQDIYIGGIIGQVNADLNLNNSYSISSIIADSIAPKSIKSLNVSAIVGGKLSTDEKPLNGEIKAVYYSSDYAMFTDNLNIGKNISGQALIYSEIWHSDLMTEDGTKNAIWTSKGYTDSKLPYIASLESGLTQFSVIDKHDGESRENYKSGTAMRPVQISGASTSFTDKYQYYLIASTSSGTLPVLKGYLNGVLMGQDEAFTLGSELPGVYAKDDLGVDGSYSGSVPAILKHSAVSNLHINIADDNLTTFGREVSLSNVGGIIAGINLGVISNCSVQGDAITLNNRNAAGLIAGVNDGLIVYSYSSAEILDTTSDLAGIVHTNRSTGKLLSNYFTGYIETGSKAAGILVAKASGMFAYNNYMAGVIKSEGVKNNFSAEVLSDGEGEKNFIDSYSDINFTEESGPVRSVSTYQLMNGEILSGFGLWYVSAVDNMLVTDSDWFGLNYNYPIIKLNKLGALSGSDYINQDLKNQLYTGKGTGLGTSEGTDYTSFNNRYSAIANETDNAYRDAFKIPHLGVLTSINSLLGSNRNYVLIYDIDGEKEEEDGTCQGWKAIGHESVNGFKNPNYDTTVEPIHKFQGLFATNKFYACTTASADFDNRCIIENLSGDGLFTNIHDAYFTNILFGSFMDMDKSGPLGKDVIGENVYVGSLTYQADSSVVGLDSDTTYYYSALFGQIMAGAEVTIYGFSSEEESASPETSSVSLLAASSAKPSVRLKSKVSTGSDEAVPEMATVGLLAGQVMGSLKLNDSSTASYISWFDGNKNAGGLVGLLDGGTIEGNNNIVKIYEVSSADTNRYISALGGVVASTKGTAIIRGVEVQLFASSDDMIEICADSFGGIAANTTGDKTSIKNCSLVVDGAGIKFMFMNDIDVGGNSRYYGLIVGKQASNLEVSSFEISTEKNKKELQIKVATANPDLETYEDTNTNCGVGAFVGCQSGDLTVNGYNSYDTQIVIFAKGVPNIGGIAGYRASGESKLKNIELPKSTGTDTVELFVLIGTTNVGGIYGYCSGEINKTTFDDDDGSLLNADSPFAAILVSGAAKGVDYKHKNFGGLFGKWEIEQAAGTSAVTHSEPEQDKTEIINSNKIIIAYSGVQYTYSDREFDIDSSVNPSTPVYGHALNIGGVAGSLTGIVSEQISFTNKGKFEHISGSMIDTDKNVVASAGSDRKIIASTQNVGGIIGLMSNAEIHNVTNKEEIVGYQNVGGLVGYAINSKIVGNIELEEDINISYNIVKDEEGNDKLDGDGNPIYELSQEIIEVDDDKINTGDIIGVINVGGAVGYAGSGSTIEKLYSQTNVYGNANIGGLIGFNDNATIINNFITRDDPSSDEGYGVVKATYYMEVSPSGTEYDRKYIPTSVGGLAGASRAQASPDTGEIKYNIIHNVLITSSLEGEVDESEIGPVINTNKNKIASISLTGRNSGLVGNMNSSSDLYAFAGDVEFANTLTGFGGLFGSTETNSIIAMQDADENKNIIIGIDINAPLGVNVGTYYGGVEVIGAATSDPSMLSIPAIFGDNKVDGAYNIGGIVGYIKNQEEMPYNISTEDIGGAENATIKLQSRMVGMYVGGLIGRTTDNNVQNLTHDGSKITIEAKYSYYIGGIIGRAEITDDATIGYAEDEVAGSLVTAKTISAEQGILSADSPQNFGGLIGMLKVYGSGSSGLEINVQGTHDYAFTINTIENQNYTEGSSTYHAEEGTNAKVNLYTMAYYVNLDKFTISASGKTLDDNPIAPADDPNTNDAEKTGWHKDYTMVRTIQRCIPKDQNNGAAWDSIGVVFDAERIRGVVASGDEITATVYEEEVGEAKIYTEKYIGTILKDENQNFFIKDKLIDINKLKDDDIKDIKDVSNLVDIDYDAPSNGQDISTFNAIHMSVYLLIGKNPSGYPLVWASYNGKSHLFLRQKIYETVDDNGNKQGINASSGSLFEVNGYTTTASLIGEYEAPPPEEPSILAWIIAGILTVVAIGGAIISAGQSMWLLLGVCAVVGVAGIASLAVMTSMAIQKAQFNAQVTRIYGSTVDQSEGFLSSTYSREIRFEGGKIIGDTDDLDKANDQLFQPVSTERPSNFSSAKYHLSIVNYNAQTQEITKASTTEDALLLGSLDGYTITEDVSYTPEGSSTATTVTIAQKDGKAYIVNDYYVFKEGQYWINMVAASETQYPTNDFFKVPEVSVNGVQTKLDENAYYLDGGYSYIYGSFDATKDEPYSFAPNHDNFITSNNGSEAKVKYDGNEFTLTSHLTAGTEKSYEYVGDSYVTPDNLKGGYSWIQGVYYTALGATDTGAPEKRATFTYKAADQSTTGLTRGVDYIAVPYNIDGNTGEYIYKISSFPTSISGSADDIPQDPVSSQPSEDSTLTIKVYPYSFTDPYATAVTGSQDSAYYKVSESGKGIKHKVKYFLYIGGFKVEKDAEEYKIYMEVETTYKDNQGKDQPVTIQLYDVDGNKDSTISLIDILSANNSLYISSVATDETKVANVKKSYTQEGDKLYQYNALYTICTKDGENKGHVMRKDIYYSQFENNDQIYNHGKYKSNNWLYTRYRYDTDLSGQEIEGWKIAATDPAEYYYLIPKNPNSFSGWPNGKTTILIETVKVTLSANNKDVYLQSGGTTSNGKGWGSFTSA